MSARKISKILWMANFAFLLMIALAVRGYLSSAARPAEGAPEYEQRRSEKPDDASLRRTPLQEYVSLKDTLPQDRIIQEQPKKATPLDKLITVERVYAASGKCKIIPVGNDTLSNHFFKKGDEIPGIKPPAKIIQIDDDGVTFDYDGETTKLPPFKK